MNESEFIKSTEIPSEKETEGKDPIIDKIEEAYEVYKYCEKYSKKVHNDYGTYKIAKLRLEFARHELMQLINEANEKGIDLKGNEAVKNFFYNDP